MRNLAFIYLMLVLVFVSGSYAQPALSVKDIDGTQLRLLSNTDQCLVDCEAWLEWDVSGLASSIRLPDSKNSEFGIDFVKKNFAQSGLEDFGVEVWKEVPVEVPVFCEEIVDVLIPKPLDGEGQEQDCSVIGRNESKDGLSCIQKTWQQEQCGTRFEDVWQNAGDFYGFNIQKGKTYRIRIWGKKNPVLGENSVDWIPTILGERIGEWAWWNANWLNRRKISVTFNEDVNGGFPVDINKDVFDFDQCAVSDCRDLRVVCDNVVVETFFQGIEDGTPDANAVWFPIHESVSSGSTNEDCFLFYNNAAADILPADVNHHGLDSNTWLHYSFEEDAANATVFDYSGNERDGTATVNTTNFSNIGLFKRGFGDFNAGENVDTGIGLHTVTSGAINVFLKLPNVGGGQEIMGSTDAGFQNRSDLIFDCDGGTSKCGIIWANTVGGVNRFFLQTAKDYPFEEWIQLTVTWGINGAKLIIDGQIILTSANTQGFVDNSLNEWIGERNNNGTADNESSAIIDEFQIVSGASPTESFPYVLFPKTKLEFTSQVLMAEEEDFALQDVNGWRLDGFDFVEDVFPAFSVANDGNLTIDFNVFHPDNNRMRIDINYSTTATIGTGTVIVKDLNLTSDVCADQDWDDGVSSCVWDWNISGVSDNNYFIIFDLNDSVNFNQDIPSQSARIVVQGLTLTVKDENTGVPLIGISVESSKGIQTTDAAGQVTIDLVGLSGEEELAVFEDSNYSTRFFAFDVNDSASINENVFILRDTNGIDLNFQFFAFDETTLLDSYKVHVIDESENIVSIRTLNSIGVTQFFLNPDANYNFVASKDGETTLVYKQIVTTFQIPLDEQTLSTITPYDLDVRILHDLSFNNQSGTIEFYLFPNTVDNYILDLNGGVSYLPRSLGVSFVGNPLTASIQMYLPAVSAGVQSVFFTKDSLDLTTEPGILIRVFKTILGVGTVEVQSVTTDDAGTGSLSFVINDEYRLDFFDSAGVFLFSKTLNPNFTTYFVYIDIQQISAEVVATQEFITIAGFPGVNSIAIADTFDINVTIDVNSGTIDLSWLTIRNDDGNVVFNQECGSGCGFTLTRGDMNSTFAVRAIVFVRTESGLLLEEHWEFLPFDSNSGNLLASLQSPGLRTSFGCSTDLNEPCFFLLIVAIIMTLGVVFTAGAGITTDVSSLSIIAWIMIGLFTYLTWIPTEFFLLGSLAIFATVVISRRFF